MPPGISRSKMRHISRNDLFDALKPDQPGLKAVREVAMARRRKDAYSAWSGLIRYCELAATST